MSVNFELLKKLTAAVGNAGNANVAEVSFSTSDAAYLLQAVQEMHDANTNKDAEYAALMRQNDRLATQALADADALRAAGAKAEVDAKTIADFVVNAEAQDKKIAELTAKKAKKAGAADDGAA